MVKDGFQVLRSQDMGAVEKKECLSSWFDNKERRVHWREMMRFMTLPIVYQ